MERGQLQVGRRSRAKLVCLVESASEVLFCEFTILHNLIGQMTTFFWGGGGVVLCCIHMYQNYCGPSFTDTHY